MKIGVRHEFRVHSLGSLVEALIVRARLRVCVRVSWFKIHPEKFGHGFGAYFLDTPTPAGRAVKIKQFS